METIDNFLPTWSKVGIVLVITAFFIWIAYHSYGQRDMHGNKLSAISNFYANLKSSDQVLVDLYGENGEKL